MRYEKLIREDWQEIKRRVEEVEEAVGEVKDEIQKQKVKSEKMEEELEQVKTQARGRKQVLCSDNLNCCSIEVCM